MNLPYEIEQLCTGNEYWTQRIHSQLEYLSQLLLIHPELSALPLETVLLELQRRRQEAGTLTKADVLWAEAQLGCYASTAKAYRLHLVSHAHMDMDWTWSWNETVNIVIDTAKTMLALLREYPTFIYSQSQAATYEILARYAPELLPEIRRLVKDGRWEVLASTWTEHDKNMVSTESVMRHAGHLPIHL